MLSELKKAWRQIEIPIALIAAIFAAAIFLYSTFATSGDVERVDARLTRSNEFQNTEREKVRQDVKEAVNRLDSNNKETNRILTEILLEARKK